MCDVFMHLVSCDSLILTSMYGISVVYTVVCIVLVHVMSVSINKTKLPRERDQSLWKSSAADHSTLAELCYALLRILCQKNGRPKQVIYNVILMPYNLWPLSHQKVTPA